MGDNDATNPVKDDTLLFSDEIIDESEKKIEENPPWKIIIADDQDEIHSVTKLVLDDFTFKGRGLKLLSAYSGKETKQLIIENPDVAFILLDVVMETDDAGLEVVRFIREDLKNYIVQIILNTGQPGQAPEHEVITKYDINDYKSKTEFSARKLLTSITASLRSYSLSQSLNITNRKLSKYRNHLEELVEERTVELENTNKKLKLEIEERKRVEYALRQSSEIQKNILAASPIGICLVMNRTIEWVNDEMCKIFGFDHETDYKGQSIKIFYSSEKDYEDASQIIQDKLHANQSVIVDAKFKRKDGSIFPGNMKMSCKDPVFYLDQSIITISDISWRKQAEEDKIQKERLQGALEMSGSICHELNQPLQYISGASELLMMDLSEDDVYYNTICKMKSQVDRMGAITKKLMGITSYKTMEYVGGRKIIDINKASEDTMFNQTTFSDHKSSKK